MVQKGDTHYHCFGCGAHGDAISFLMTSQKMSFVDAVESLAQRFNIPLSYTESSGSAQGPNKNELKLALDCAAGFFHFMLLHSEEGAKALEYLYGRGIDLEFVHQFQIGLAPAKGGLLRKVLHAKFVKDQIMAEAGLIQPYKDGGWRDFFLDRITFPIHDATGAVIGFSARKYKEETFGGKYVNTAETPLFKKSKVLFGLHFSRKRIAKERTAIIVEGQIDALRLIQAGFNVTVAGQGTAFGEGHVKELVRLGVHLVYLALDSDPAGQEAASKIGDLFLREGVEVKVVLLPPGSDPDSFLRGRGADAFSDSLKNSLDFLTYLVRHESKKINIDSPAGKNELARTLTQKIYFWNQPLIIHESLKKLASLLNVPEAMLGLENFHTPNTLIKKAGHIILESINPDQIIETDFLRWLWLCGEAEPQFIQLAEWNIAVSDLMDPHTRQFYQTYMNLHRQGSPKDLASLANEMSGDETQRWFKEFVQKKVNKDKARNQFESCLKKILDRNWMQKREEIKLKIQSGQSSDQEVLELVRQFEELKCNPPKIKMEPSPCI